MQLLLFKLKYPMISLLLLVSLSGCDKWTTTYLVNNTDDSVTVIAQTIENMYIEKQIFKIKNTSPQVFITCINNFNRLMIYGSEMPVKDAASFEQNNYIFGSYEYDRYVNYVRKRCVTVSESSDKNVSWFSFTMYPGDKIQIGRALGDLPATNCFQNIEFIIGNRHKRFENIDRLLSRAVCHSDLGSGACSILLSDVFTE
ncbi:MAG: hypothetical protein JW822_13360 [Spirochaetales bacterium]|nr:hypothetical protein [Spirochaetales bacterium]